MHENELYKPIVDGAMKEGWVLTKIVDGSVGKKPFDMFGIGVHNEPVAVEVKVWRNAGHPFLIKHGLPDNVIKLFESQQLNWLRLYAQRDATSIALIYHMTWDRMFIYSFNYEQFIGELTKMPNQTWGRWDKCYLPL